MLIPLFLLLSCLVIGIHTACPCDTTTGCDLLCCCDTECTSTDKTSFQCETSVTTSEPENTVCVSNNLINRINNNSFTVSVLDQKTCFTTTETVQSETRSVYHAKSSSISAVSSSATYTKTFGYNASAGVSETLKLDDPIYYEDENEHYRVLVLPGSFRGFCVSDSVFFLRNTSASCSHIITSDLCTRNSKIDTFSYKATQIIGNFRSSRISKITATATCYTADGTIRACTQPTSTGSACNNVVTAIQLILTHSSGTGLTSAMFHLTTATVSFGASAPLSTRVAYHSEDSGSYPNTPATLQHYKSSENLKFIVDEQMSSFAPFQDDSECSCPPLGFASSRIESCTKTYTDRLDCPTMMTTLTSSLPSALARYSNAEQENTEMWLNLTWDIPSAVTCSNTPLSAALFITYKSSGNRLAPDNEIVSATTRIVQEDLTALNKIYPTGNQAVFYFAVQFISVDVPQKEDILSRVADTFPRYSPPVQMLFVAVVVFLALALGVVLNDQGKPSL